MPRKRGQNEGTIYKRADGRWEAQYTYQDATGRTRRKSIYGKTRKEVQQQLTAALAALDRDEAPLTDRQTVGQFLERWLADVVEPHRAPDTHRTYAGVVRLHLLPTLGKVQLGKLTPQQVQALLTTKARGDLAGKDRTVQQLREVLRNALNVALRWGLVAKNAAELVDPTAYRRPEVCPLSADEAHAFLAVAGGDRLEALYTVALALGLRKGEALGLKWEDIDEAAGVIRVRRQLQRVKGKLILRDLKTAKSRRNLPLPAALVGKLHAHRARQAEAELLAHARWQHSDLVFTSTIGTPLDPRNVTRRFHALIVKAGLPHQRFHDLRHLCASLLLAQGVPPRVVMETLGHSQISLTMNTYSHVMPSLQREAADRMDAFLGGGKADQEPRQR